jgi:hypothetical protein
MQISISHGACKLSYSRYGLLGCSTVQSGRQYQLWHTDSLQGNDGERNETMAVTRQRPVRKTTEVLLEAVFSIWSVPRLLHATDRVQFSYPRVELGSNTSTVTLRVVEGDEKGSLKSETVKCGRESQGLGPEKDCSGKGQQQRGRPPPKNKTETVKQ